MIKLVGAGQRLINVFPSTMTYEEKYGVTDAHLSGRDGHVPDRQIPVTATIVSIPSHRRFAVVRFDFAGGSFCECVPIARAALSRKPGRRFHGKA